MRKFAAAVATTLTLGTGGVYGADRVQNPYDDKGTHYELPIKAQVQQGERVEIAKDRAAITLKGWHGEYAITIEPQIPGQSSGTDRSFKTNANRPLLSKKMEYRSGDVTAFIEPKTGTENEFDIDFTLDAKPETHVFTYKIEGAENFDFFYQPELTPEEIAEGAQRPENVIGSYAVYHKTKANHVEGQTNYATGKAFHIYRPKAIDANGAEIWGELGYSNGKLSVTVPEAWLETAAYPVIVDPTMGYSTAGASTVNGNNPKFSLATASSSGALASLHVYALGAFGGAISSAIYNASGSVPSTFVASSTQGSMPDQDAGQPASWVVMPVTASVVGSTNYFLGARTTNTANSIYFDSGGLSATDTTTGATYPAWPSTATLSGADTTRNYSIYASYTLTSGSTFGLTANNGSVQTQSADRKYVYSATPASSGTLYGGVARVWLSASGNSQAKLVVYSDSAGSPSALLAQSDQVTITATSETAHSFSFSGANQISIVSGTPYWIGIHFSDPGTPNFTISRANNASLVRSDLDTYSDGPANPCSCATSSNGGLDIYIEYTTALTAAPQDGGIIWFD